MDLLSWFAPLSIWDQYLTLEWDKFKLRYPGVSQIPIEALDRCYTIFFLSLNCKNLGNGEVAYAPQIKVYRSHEWPLSPLGSPHLRYIEKLLFISNREIPDEIWPKPSEDTPWDKIPTKYTQQFKKILDEINKPSSSTTEPGPSSTSSDPVQIPSSTEKTEESQPIRFQSEGPSYEEDFRFMQWSQDPYDQEPFDPEELKKLGITNTSTTSQASQSCTFKYSLTPVETHSTPS